MVIKHFTLIILACVYVQVIACGQEREQKQVHEKTNDYIKDMAQGGKNIARIDLLQWNDNSNSYTSQNSKNIRFILSDSILHSSASLKGIIFYDNSGNIKNKLTINEMNWESIAKQYNFFPKCIFDEKSANHRIYDLRSVDTENLKKLLHNVELDTRIYQGKLPEIMVVNRPIIFNLNEQVVLCTEILFYYDSKSDEDLLLGGRTLIQFYNVDGVEIFNYFDTNTSTKGIFLTQDKENLIQRYGLHSEEGDFNSKPGLKVYNLKNKSKVWDYRFDAAYDVSYNISYIQDKEYKLIYLLSDGIEKYEVIYFDLTNQKVFAKNYGRANNLYKSEINIIKNDILFKNPENGDIILKDNFSTFKIIQKK